MWMGLLRLGLSLSKGNQSSASMIRLDSSLNSKHSRITNLQELKQSVSSVMTQRTHRICQLVPPTDTLGTLLLVINSHQDMDRRVC